MIMRTHLQLAWILLFSLVITNSYSWWLWDDAEEATDQNNADLEVVISSDDHNVDNIEAIISTDTVSEKIVDISTEEVVKQSEDHVKETAFQNDAHSENIIVNESKVEDVKVKEDSIEDSIATLELGNDDEDVGHYHDGEHNLEYDQKV